MAATKKSQAQKVAKEAPAPEYITQKELLKSMRTMLGEVRTMIREEVAASVPSKAVTPAEAAEEKAITAAAPNKYTVNPEWEEMAREIIGPALDHTEIEYAKGGGMKFTIVVKNELSNASQDYLERNKVDRRTREIGAEGEAGVKTWCQQVAGNLKRPKLAF